MPDIPEIETPAALLRRAAGRLRELSGAATAGPWRAHDTHLGQYGHTATLVSGEGNTTDLRAWLPSMSQQSWDERRNVWADAEYIAAMHPGVGLALAVWLDAEARRLEATARPEWQEIVGAHALAVARQILGEVS